MEKIQTQKGKSEGKVRWYALNLHVSVQEEI